MMTVEPYDRGRFLVTSETNAEDVYIVDILTGSGTCQCKDFLGRSKKKLNLTCKHIREVKRHIADMVIAKMKQEEPEETAF